MGCQNYNSAKAKTLRLPHVVQTITFASFFKETIYYINLTKRINPLNYFSTVLSFIYKPLTCFSSTKQMTGFYVKSNTGLKRVNDRCFNNMDTSNALQNTLLVSIRGKRWSKFLVIQLKTELLLQVRCYSSTKNLV